MTGTARRAAIVAGYVAVFWGALPGALWTLGAGADRWLPPAPATARATGALLTLGGSAFLAWSMLHLIRRGRGLPISHLPPGRMVVTGPYRWARHPIYVGYTLAFSGVGLWAGSLGNGLVSAAVLTAAWIVYARRFEEPRLRRRYGAAYDAYAARTGLFGIGRHA